MSSWPHASPSLSSVQVLLKSMLQSRSTLNACRADRRCYQRSPIRSMPAESKAAQQCELSYAPLHLCVKAKASRRRVHSQSKATKQALSHHLHLHKVSGRCNRKGGCLGPRQAMQWSPW